MVNGEEARQACRAAVVPIYFDYGSALCYIAWRIVSALEDELGFTALWKGVPLAARDCRVKPGAPIDAAQQAKVLRVSCETGVAVRPLLSWPDSAAALEGLELARAAGRAGSYHAAVFRAAFEQRADIANSGLLTQLAQRCAMDGSDFAAALDAHLMAAKLEENRREAERFSALGYPAFLLGEFTLIGVQSIDTMRAVLGRFIRQRAAQPSA